jgi:hypothetical protein
MDNAMTHERRSDSSQTIPCPAIKCAHSHASGARCKLNAIDGGTCCPLHTATPVITRTFVAPALPREFT